MMEKAERRRCSRITATFPCAGGNSQIRWRPFFAGKSSLGTDPLSTARNMPRKPIASGWRLSRYTKIRNFGHSKRRTATDSSLCHLKNACTMGSDLIQPTQPKMRLLKTSSGVSSVVSRVFERDLCSGASLTKCPDAAAAPSRKPHMFKPS